MNDNDMRLLRKLGHPELGLGLRLGLSGGSGFNPAILFANGEKGLIWDFSVASSLYSDAGTTPAVLDGAIGRVVDQSPNGVTGNQATAGSKPLWKSIGGKYAALFDGTDDFLSTAAVDFSGTDEVTVFAGVRKLSDAARANVVELGTSGGNGSFIMLAPRATTLQFGFQSRGTSLADNFASSASYNAPVTAVLTGLGNIGGDINTLRINGTEIATVTSDQGTGNYSNAVLYVGERSDTADALNGYIYALVIVGRVCTATEIGLTEGWINDRTGAY